MLIWHCPTPEEAPSARPPAAAPLPFFYHKLGGISLGGSDGQSKVCPE